MKQTSHAAMTRKELNEKNSKPQIVYYHCRCSEDNDQTPIGTFIACLFNVSLYCVMVYAVLCVACVSPFPYCYPRALPMAQCGFVNLPRLNDAGHGVGKR